MLPQGIHWLLLALGLFSNVCVMSLPWDAMSGQASFESMVVGATPLEGQGPLKVNQVPHFRHLGLRGGHDATGNLTVLTHLLNPPQFIITRKQLYYYMNSTTIYPVNVLNTTLHERPPLQLVVGKKIKGIKGIKGGHWRYAGSMLYYDFPGKLGSQAVLWSCPLTENAWPVGVFMFAPKENGHTPNCDSMTFHSWANGNK